MHLLDEKPVVTLEGLLERLYFHWDSRKCTAELHFFPDSNTCWVHEVWAGREYEGTEEATEVDRTVVQEARAEGYIVGKPKCGYTSKIDFIISEVGIKKYVALEKERESQKTETS